MLSRLFLQRVLGFIWLLDGILQMKPAMFTSSFVTQVIAPVGESQPSWIARSVHWMIGVISPHIGAWNVVFALVQLLLGVGLILNFRVRTTLALSIVWSVLVWWFGEGFGQMLTGQSLGLTGAPGAVLLYAMIAVAVWPFGGSAAHRDSPIGGRGLTIARWSLGLLWLLMAGLQFQPAYLSSDGMAGAVAVDWIGKAIGSHGAVVSIALGIVEAVIAIGILRSRRTNTFLWISIVMAFLFWWIGQSFGQMLTPVGTDPNAGPLYILLALCASPAIVVGARRRSAGDPRATSA